MRAELCPPESSPQHARIRSSSGLKVMVYDGIGSDSRDGAGCGKGDVVADFRSLEVKNFYGHIITIVQKSWRWLRRTLGRFPTLSSPKARTDVAAGLLPMGHIRRVSSAGIFAGYP